MITIRRLLRKLRDDERGSITPFFVVFVPALVLIVGLVVDGAGKVQANQQAYSTADGAARAAANAVSGQAIIDGTTAIDSNRARNAADG